MKELFLSVLFLMTGASASELNSDQLEGLSDCDYFKYTECTSAKLTIGACVKNKYEGFVKACGKVHADKFIYSREMFKPEVSQKSGAEGESCEAAQSRLCQKDGLSLSQCASKHKKDLGKACGDKFLDEAGKATSMDKCFSLREKLCGKDMTADCDARFEAQAPKECTGAVPISDKPIAPGMPSEKGMLSACMGTINKACKLDEEEMMKDGVDAAEYMRKYQICVQRAVQNASGKCGAMIPDKDKIIEEKSKGN